jgi:hypothetical protein
MTDFHAFTIRYNGLTRRITTEIVLTFGFDPAQPPVDPVLEHHTTALWDTGATQSVITRATAEALQLIPVGQTLVNHAGGCSQANTYVVNVILPNKVGFIGVLVSECPDVVGNFGAIVGMDIISQSDFSITNVADQTWMSVRTPSIEPIDYVVEANRIRFAGTGRNDPCPCGKRDAGGKPVKFKHCHGRNAHV